LDCSHPTTGIDGCCARAARDHVTAAPIPAMNSRRCKDCLHHRIVSSPNMSTPMRRTRSPCCARATTGHAAALPSRRVDGDVAILIPHSPGCADFPLPVLHGRASLAKV
jgi:hypothetical protein